MPTESTYPISSVAYCNRAAILFHKHTECEPSILYYCALEIRCCIERILYEYIELSNINSSAPSKRKHTYRPKSLKQSILDIEPNFYNIQNFTNIIFQSLNLDLEIQAPDLDKLNKHYGIMGNYLHAPLSSTEQHVTKERLLRFKDQIKEALDYLISILEKNRAHPTLNDKGAHFFKLYCSGIFSQEAIRQNMSLALTP